MTLQDLAAAAGVSTATVDRVLNDRPGVHARTRERVWAAARSLSYVDGGAPGGERVGGFDILLPRGPNPFFDRLEQAIADRAFGFGVNVRIARCDRERPEEYLSRLEAVGASSTAGGVGLLAPDHPVIREALRSLAAAKAPVFTVVADLPGAERQGYIGMENHGVGRLAGQVMSRFLPEAPATVAVVVGLSNYRNHVERDLGFRSLIAQDAPHLRVLPVRLSRDQPEGAAEVLESLLRETPDLAGVYNTGAGADLMAAALERCGRANEVVLIGHELTDGTRARLITGSLDAVIDQNAEVTALALLEALIAARAGRSKGPPKPLPAQLILRENLPA